MEALGKPETIYILSPSDLEEAFRRIAAQVQAERERELKGTKISRKAAAKRLGKDTSTFWRWDKSGYLKAYHQGASVFYWEADVKKIENGER